MTNDKTDIPDGERLDIAEETDLDVPELPGEWRWTTANHQTWNHKVNVYFGKDENSPGGLLGEIDNYVHDGEEVWDAHIRSIQDDGTETGRVPGEADTIDHFDTLAEAIEAVPDIIATYYEAE